MRLAYLYVVFGVFVFSFEKKASVRADVLVRDPSLRHDFWSFTRPAYPIQESPYTGKVN